MATKEYKTKHDSYDGDIKDGSETHKVVSTRYDWVNHYTNRLLAIPDAVLGQLSTVSFPPAIAASRMAIVSMMSHSITWGQIRILTADHGIYTFPSAQKREEEGLPPVSPDQVVDVRVINDAFWFRLVVLADIGFAEAYMAGDCEVSDLVQVFKVGLVSCSSSTSSLLAQH